MKNFLRRLWALITSLWSDRHDTRVLQVYHHDSPGMRVFVKRTWWQRLLRNRTFSVVGEKHLSMAEAFPALVGTRELLTQARKTVEDFNAWLEKDKRG